ncbi:MAG: RNA polymerase sigma factor [Dysgonamonadaceae bacterium]|nr:RNA polymerase sigma factor [Dysgonamonadaceae bacterium]
MNTLQFREKILNIQDNMFNFALSLTGNRSDAYDLLQDTTLKALDNERKYIDNVNFKGWILTIMRNIFINNYRKMMRMQTIIDQTDDLYHLNFSQDSGFDSPESSYAVKEINIAITDLNSDLRRPFSLFLAGYKYNEIADRLVLPLGTVKSRIFFARQELQKSLRDMR